MNIVYYQKFFKNPLQRVRIISVTLLRNDLFCFKPIEIVAFPENFFEKY